MPGGFVESDEYFLVLLVVVEVLRGEPAVLGVDEDDFVDVGVEHRGDPREVLQEEIRS